MTTPSPIDDAAAPRAALQALGWTPERIETALKVAVPNDRRIAQAALALPTPEDGVAGFGPWCDRQARRTEADR